MQALDSIICPIPSFEGDILIPTIPILPNLLAARPIVTLLLELVPTHRGLGQASEKPPPTQLLKRKPRKLQDNL
jgi:hypothetical protein